MKYINKPIHNKHVCLFYHNAGKRNQTEEICNVLIQRNLIVYKDLSRRADFIGILDRNTLMELKYKIQEEEDDWFLENAKTLIKR